MGNTLKLIPLSGSTHGKMIKIVELSTPGTLIHTALASTTDGQGDRIYLWAHNSHSSSLNIALEMGGVAVPDDQLVFTLTTKQTLPLLSGFFLRNALVVRAIGGAANLITVFGHVVRSS